MKFTLDNPPITNDAEILRQWVVDQLERLQPIVNLSLVDASFTEPLKPRDGLIVYAPAGAGNWDPGSGQGLYGYYNSTWNKL